MLNSSFLHQGGIYLQFSVGWWGGSIGRPCTCFKSKYIHCLHCLKKYLIHVAFSVHTEMGQETQKTVEMIDSIESQSKHLYYADLPGDLPYIPPNPSLCQKSGYLFLRR